MRSKGNVLALLLLSCGGGSGGGPVDPDASEVGLSRLEVVRGIASGALLPAHRALATETVALESAVLAWEASGTPEDRSAAQEAWRRAMRSAQVAEVMQVGPSGAMDLTVGGEDLRDAIYSWPIVNRCRVDQELASGAYEDADAFARENVNVRGLDALEQLLFIDGTENGCAPNSALNTSGDWAAITGELPARRAAYAATVAMLVRRDAAAVEARWNEAFGAELRSAGEGSALFPSAQEALNGISDALFYVDKETKDMKVAIPGGIAQCDAEVCPEARESLYANVSLAHITENLRGFDAVFNGGEGLGFDDLLASLGAEGLVVEINAATDAAISAATSIEGDMQGALMANPAALQPLFDAIKTLTDLLKTQFLTVLDLELPNRAEGDND